MVGSASKVYYVRLCVGVYKQNVDELCDRQDGSMRELLYYDYRTQGLFFF